MQEFKQLALGLLHFFTVDPAVPATVREKMATYGLCKDEYSRTEHWMSQLYVRTALRMVLCANASAGRVLDLTLFACLMCRLVGVF